VRDIFQDFFQALIEEALADPDIVAVFW